MKAETLKELCEMQRRYAEIYNTPEGLCGITDKYVHILDREFLELFDEYEIEERPGNEYDQLYTNYCGVKIIALTYRKEEE